MRVMKDATAKEAAAVLRVLLNDHNIEPGDIGDAELRFVRNIEVPQTLRATIDERRKSRQGGAR